MHVINEYKHPEDTQDQRRGRLQRLYQKFIDSLDIKQGRHIPGVYTLRMDENGEQHQYTLDGKYAGKLEVPTLDPFTEEELQKLGV